MCNLINSNSMTHELKQASIKAQEYDSQPYASWNYDDQFFNNLESKLNSLN